MNGITAVIGCYRFNPGCCMVLEILGRKKTVIPLGKVYDGLTDLTLIKGLNTIPGNLAIGPSQVPISKDLPRSRGLSINKIGP